MKVNNRTDGQDSQTCGHIGPQAPLTPRKIRGWKGLRAPSAETVRNGHEASGRAYKQKCIARKLDEVLGPVDGEEEL